MNTSKFQKVVELIHRVQCEHCQLVLEFKGETKRDVQIKLRLKQWDMFPKFGRNQSLLCPTCNTKAEAEALSAKIQNPERFARQQLEEIQCLHDDLVRYQRLLDQAKRSQKRYTRLIAETEKCIANLTAETDAVFQASSKAENLTSCSP